jgi:hypothetical protein
VRSARVYILDHKRQPVPAGVVGELHVAGQCLALGYVNLPDETAQKFVHDPWSGLPRARMYRTGDLARWSRSGEIHFVGRNDDQLKIRGYRVERSEVEAVLGGHPDVADAVVVVRGRGTRQRLIAYVRWRSNGERGELDLREYLRAHLPDFMIPSSVHELLEFPRTPSGKIDRSALPDPSSLEQDETPASAPMAALEAALSRRWAELLSLNTIGPDLDVFGVGAHSLMVVRFIAWLRATFGLDVPVRLIFEKPTVRGMARAIIDQVVGDICDQRGSALLEDVEKHCETGF